MLKRLCLALLFCGFALPACATDYSDMWWLPAESGWGVNFTQNEGVIFMTFFIYGPGNQPTWYVAIAYRDANGNFAGNLYSTVGSYFGAPWNPAEHPAATLAGSASFVPTSPYQGTLTYSLTGGPTVTKSIERQTLTTIALNGNYSGGQAGAYTGCTNSGDNFAYKDYYDLQVAQANGNVTFTFNYSGGLSCTLSGTLTQNGQLYRMNNATYVCSDGLNTNASMSEIKATSLGIEGRFAAPSVALGCREDASFSAVFLSP
jgi:hypothetical protein